MIRQNIKIGPHTYIVDLYKYYELDTEVKSNFSMIRNINFFNYIAVDNDIFIVDNSILEDPIKSNKIIYPISSTIEQYSINIEDFTNYEETYPLLNSDGSLKQIKCDKVRIYHPLTKVHNKDIIIGVNNNINGINFHLFTKLYNDNYLNSENEFKVYTDVYSEYIEFYIPAIEEIISTSTFFIEDTGSCNIDTKLIDTFTETEKITNGTKEVIINRTYSDYKPLYDDLIKTIDNKTYCSTYLFRIPFSVENDRKVFLPEVEQSINNMYFTYPINIGLYPFAELSEDGIFLAHNELESNIDVFVLEPKISLISLLDFNDDGKLVVKSKFNFSKIPGKTFNSLTEEYEYFNGISISEYDNIYYENKEELIENKDILITNSSTDTEYKQYQCVYKITIASDPAFKNIIYTSPNYNNYRLTTDNDTNENTLLNEIVNKEFEIPIFTTWDQLPETLICKTTFIDRYVGSILESNFVIITKEYYKYLVNYEEDYIQIYKATNLMDKVNFYDKIVCNVKLENNENTNISNSINNTKIIYKPIFYKTQDLQNIQLQQGVTQNIGINLNNYMTKVNTFYIVIDNVRFIEIGRNDIYVIFNIQCNKLKNKFGSYYVTNEEDDYISSGNWSII